MAAGGERFLRRAPSGTGLLRTGEPEWSLFPLGVTATLSQRLRAALPWLTGTHPPLGPSLPPGPSPPWREPGGRVRAARVGGILPADGSLPPREPPH